jgi:hypothetical protein
LFPEDRVLVGVINRKRDLHYAQTQNWYRIPQKRMARGVNAEYVAFFLSRAFKERNSAIHYYAPTRGLELAYRKDLIPTEADHPRADDVYYKIQIGDMIEKVPPVLNPTHRTIGFIYTTWDRFVNAETIRDLYSKEDYFVDRVYHALRQTGIPSDRTWQAEYPGIAPQVRVLCENGTFTASTEAGSGVFFLDASEGEDKLLAAIKAEIARQGGPVFVNIPLEGT